MSQWVQQDRPHALAWFSNVPAGEARDEAIIHFWDQIYQSGDIVQAQQWLSSMSDAQKRSTHLFYLARRWIQRDPTAAQAWMATTNDLSADTKQKLIATYARPQQ
jgi:TPR repeat protein